MPSILILAIIYGFTACGIGAIYWILIHLTERLSQQ